MKKCTKCGREGTAPDVRGVKSAGVNLGNFRLAIDISDELCEECAGKAMARAMDELILALGIGGAR